MAADDIGNKIIVPKDGESFADTMNRGAKYGETVTPEQITTQAKRGMKDDVPAVLAGAPVVGATGAALLSLAGEIIPVGQSALHFTEAALEKFAESYPHLSKVAEAMGIGSGIAGAYKLFSKILKQ